MNENKEGKPFLFPDFFIMAVGYIRSAYQLSYRKTEGVLEPLEKVCLQNQVTVISAKELTS
jgi:hypothetical protein